MTEKNNSKNLKKAEKSGNLWGLVLVVVVGLLTITASLTLTLVWWLTLPVNPDNQETTTFVIPRGQAISVIGRRLTEEGYLKHPLVFRGVVALQGLEHDLQAGSFALSPSMTPAEIAQTLTSGTEDVWITIVEGWRKEQIADSLAQQDLPEFDPDEFLELVDGQEGYLYPDTYLVPKLATAETIADLLLSTFERKVEQPLAEELAAAAAAGRSLDEVLTFASLLEREAQGFTDMQQVAGALQNRLDIGMPLQVDATLQYVKGYNTAQQDWWAPPLAADKALDSPYNTYQNPGLPPAPIANPGLDAVRAVLDPADNDYLYYIHDRTGQIHFAQTLEQHNANVERYLRR